MDFYTNYRINKIEQVRRLPCSYIVKVQFNNRERLRFMLNKYTNNWALIDDTFFPLTNEFWDEVTTQLNQRMRKIVGG